jgi:hypothetical protein
MVAPACAIWLSATVGVENGFHYLMPYVMQPDKWKKQQITKYSADGYVFPGLAGIGLLDRALLTEYFKLPRSQSGWVQLVDIRCGAKKPGGRAFRDYRKLPLLNLAVAGAKAAPRGSHGG